MPSQKHFSSFFPKQKNAGFSVFKPITPFEVEAEILSITLNKVHGLHSWPTRTLWNVTVKSSRALYAKLLTIQLKLGPTRRD